MLITLITLSLLAGSPLSPVAQDPVSGSAQQEPETSSVFTGRLLDEHLRPLAGAKVACDYQQYSEGSGYGNFVRMLETDSRGEFAIEVTMRTPLVGRRHLGFSRLQPFDPGFPPQLRDSQDVDISNLGPGDHGIGDVVMLTPNARTYLSNLSDEELVAFYENVSGMDAHKESVLLEMARRGPVHVDFLQERFQAIGDPAHLIALRRAQGSPEPIHFEVLEDSLLSSTFPFSPILRCRVVNVDTGGASVRVVDRRLSCRWAASTGSGSLMYQPIFPRMGQISRSVLHPGDSIDFDVDLTDSVRFPRPGTYSGRLLYADSDHITQLRDIAGLIVLESEALELQLNARNVHSTPELQARIKDWITGLELEDPIVLVHTHWTPGMEFTSEADTNRERLFRAGYEAVPALIDSLAEEAAPLVLANRAALLWNISGHGHPREGVPFALGTYSLVGKWPTASGPVAPGFSRRATASTKSPVDRRGLEKLIARWIEARDGFRLVLDG